MAKNVTAFVLDENVAVGAEGATIPGVPGIWFKDQPMLPAALGYTLAELREAIDILGLPLVEVSVGEKKASDTFPLPPNQLESARELPGAAARFGGRMADAADQEALLHEPDPSVLDAAVDKGLQIEEEGAVDA